MNGGPDAPFPSPVAADLSAPPPPPAATSLVSLGVLTLSALLLPFFWLIGWTVYLLYDLGLEVLLTLPLRESASLATLVGSVPAFGWLAAAYGRRLQRQNDDLLRALAGVGSVEALPEQARTVAVLLGRQTQEFSRTSERLAGLAEQVAGRVGSARSRVEELAGDLEAQSRTVLGVVHREMESLRQAASTAAGVLDGQTERLERLASNLTGYAHNLFLDLEQQLDILRQVADHAIGQSDRIGQAFVAQRGQVETAFERTDTLVAALQQAERTITYQIGLLDEASLKAIDFSERINERLRDYRHLQEAGQESTLPVLPVRAEEPVAADLQDSVEAPSALESRLTPQFLRLEGGLDGITQALAAVEARIDGHGQHLAIVGTAAAARLEQIDHVLTTQASALAQAIDDTRSRVQALAAEVHAAVVADAADHDAVATPVRPASTITAPEPPGHDLSELAAPLAALDARLQALTSAFANRLEELTTAAAHHLPPALEPALLRLEQQGVALDAAGERAQTRLEQAATGLRQAAATLHQDYGDDEAAGIHALQTVAARFESLARQCGEQMAQTLDAGVAHSEAVLTRGTAALQTQIAALGAAGEQTCARMSAAGTALEARVQALALAGEAAVQRLEQTLQRLEAVPDNMMTGAEGPRVAAGARVPEAGPPEALQPEALQAAIHAAATHTHIRLEEIGATLAALVDARFSDLASELAARLSPPADGSAERSETATSPEPDADRAAIMAQALTGLIAAEQRLATIQVDLATERQRLDAERRQWEQQRADIERHYGQEADHRRQEGSRLAAETARLATLQSELIAERQRLDVERRLWEQQHASAERHSRQAAEQRQAGQAEERAQLLAEATRLAEAEQRLAVAQTTLAAERQRLEEDRARRLAERQQLDGDQTRLHAGEQQLEVERHRQEALRAQQEAARQALEQAETDMARQWQTLTAAQATLAAGQQALHAAEATRDAALVVLTRRLRQPAQAVQRHAEALRAAIEREQLWQLAPEAEWLAEAGSVLLGIIDPGLELLHHAAGAPDPRTDTLSPDALSSDTRTPDAPAAATTAPRTILANEILTSVARRIGPQAELHGHRLALVVGASAAAPLPWSGDVGRLCTILATLADNACRYSDHGTVRLMAAVTGEGRSAAVCFSVADDGPGLSPAQRALLLSTGRGDAAEIIDNDGLGLRVAAALAARLNARFTVATGATGGSVITLTVPLG